MFDSFSEFDVFIMLLLFILYSSIIFFDVKLLLKFKFDSDVKLLFSFIFNVDVSLFILESVFIEFFFWILPVFFFI